MNSNENRTGFYPESKADLASFWHVQARKLASLYAPSLGLSEKEYIASLPDFDPQSDAFQGRFDIPLIVETRLPLSRYLKLAQIECNYNVWNISDWSRSKFQTPRSPYTAWVNDGTVNATRSVDNVRLTLWDDERGVTIFEGVALYLSNPALLALGTLDFPGSQTHPEGAPSLQLYNKKPMIFDHYTNHSALDCLPITTGITPTR